jgi:hypothetical protein
VWAALGIGGTDPPTATALLVVLASSPERGSGFPVGIQGRRIDHRAFST